MCIGHFEGIASCTQGYKNGPEDRKIFAARAYRSQQQRTQPRCAYWGANKAATGRAWDEPNGSCTSAQLEFGAARYVGSW